MSSFDFNSYIQRRLGDDVPDPNVDSSASQTPDLEAGPSRPTFSVQILTGGLTNHTARVSFSDPLRDVLPKILPNDTEVPNNGILDQKSVILKHAPPYIAADPSQAMSVDRQLIEKLALQLLNAENTGRASLSPGPDFGMKLDELFRARGALDESSSSATVSEKMCLHIPRLIWHDQEQNVLWIEDLGEMRTLSKVLLDNPASAEIVAEDKVRIRLKKVASDLGTFLARLYSLTSNPPERLLTSLTSSSDPGGFHDYLANMVLENLQRPEAGVSSEEARVLADRVMKGLKENAELVGQDVCLGMVDFWPESVLVDLGVDGAAVGGGDTRSPRCGLVDWEYFGPSNGASELGMFLAHLHVHMLNSSTPIQAKKWIQMFAQGMCQAYIESRASLEQDDSKISLKPSKGFQRRVLLSHGRELVNGVALYEKKLDEAAKRRVLAAGMRSLRAAGISEDDLNLDILRADGRGGSSEEDLGEVDGLDAIWREFAALGFAL